MSLVFFDSVVKGQSITFSLKEAPIETVFRSIESQSKYKFIYSAETIRMALPVTLTAKASSLLPILNELFRAQPLSYSLEEHYIMVRLKKDSAIQTGKYIVRGKVMDETGVPIAGVTLQVKGSGIAR
ncbi:MAG TPA: hypothetical protein VEY06_15490, partial [Flavisolibacter sp.]|nr:hypothetical protein [Flavisolibacter sp.]